MKTLLLLPLGVGVALACEPGQVCDPIPVATFPFVDAGDTTVDGGTDLDSYACAPDLDLSGREVVYEVAVPRRGVLAAGVDDVRGDAVDVDVHLLSSLDASTCVQRHNRSIAAVVDPGTWYVVVDTFVTHAGDVGAGPFTVRINLEDLPTGPCATVDREVRMAWRACGAGLDCEERDDPPGRTRAFLSTPIVGPVVREAHLVTAGEAFPAHWPSGARDQIDRHYRVSEAASGYTMPREEPWAPEGEGGSRWGEGALARHLPADAEAWYVNMYWSPRPPAGTRIILMNPLNGRAVVAAGGYETGPTSNERIGGTTEEAHDYLGTEHGDPLVLGFAADATLVWGPIDCGP